MFTFANQVVLITGAASGLGRQLALNLAGEGAAIAALDLQAEPLETLVAALPGKRVATMVADVTDLAAMRKATDQFQQQLGPIDLLIASAGVGTETSALNFRGEDVESMVRVNLIGVANCIDALLPSMVKRRRGHLAAISSLASYRGLPLMAGYCATKAGVNALLEALRVELHPYGISTTIICPSWVRTPMTANLKLQMHGILEVDDAARRIVEALRQRRPFFAFPSRSARHARLLRWLPVSISDWLVARLWRKMGRG